MFPVKAGSIIVNFATAMQAGFDICAALFAREKTAKGAGDSAFYNKPELKTDDRYKNLFARNDNELNKKRLSRNG